MGDLVAMFFPDMGETVRQTPARHQDFAHRDGVRAWVSRQVRWRMTPRRLVRATNQIEPMGRDGVHGGPWWAHQVQIGLTSPINHAAAENSSNAAMAEAAYINDGPPPI